MLYVLLELQEFFLSLNEILDLEVVAIAVVPLKVWPMLAHPCQVLDPLLVAGFLAVHDLGLDHLWIDLIK